MLRLVFLLSVMGFAVGCGDDSEDTPPDSSRPLRDAAGLDGGVGDGSVTDGCTGPNDCYSCPPTTNLQFLNQCTTSECSPFDNVDRIPGFVEGEPLPEELP